MPGSNKEWAWALLRVGLVFFVLALAIGIATWWVASMPGSTFTQALPQSTTEEETTAVNARRHVDKLAGEIGERNLQSPEALESTARYVEATLASHGWQVSRHTFDVEGTPASNIVAQRKGSSMPDEIVVVGAHYDTAWGTPGADDNASGVAALLELGRLLGDKELKRTVRLVGFVNEEPPHFQNDTMGSLQYARHCAEQRDDIVAAIALEMLGYYVDKPGLQKYPPPLDRVYPEIGNFVGFVGNIESGNLVRKTIGLFRESTKFPSEGLVGPTFINGVDFSDHWSFWQAGYQGIMVTDTAFFRNPHYHQPTDTPDRLDYDRMARVTVGLSRVIETLANE